MCLRTMEKLVVVVVWVQEVLPDWTMKRVLCSSACCRDEAQGCVLSGAFQEGLSMTWAFGF